MCIIAASPKGAKQPDWNTLYRMFQNNPHGAGYMTARNGAVEISKGFMTWEEFRHAVHYENFTADDPVVYHFRISTQAGVNPQMTHPFPLTNSIEACKLLDCACPIGVAHNGIISMTSNSRDKVYSDTAHYIAEFLCYLIRCPEDAGDKKIQSAIYRTTHSKWAFMDAEGEISTVGDFITEDGIHYSNGSFRPHSHGITPTLRRPFTLADFDDADCFL